MVASIQKIRSIFEQDKGGSYSNEFSVKIIFDAVKQEELISTFSLSGFNVESSSEGAYGNMLLLCDEASLPGQYSATNEIDGLYGGRLIQYPQAKLYNDFSLSFILTNKFSTAKFFDIWFYYMFPEFELNTGKKIDYGNRSRRSSRTNVTALRYYDQTVCSAIEVTKFYKTKDAANGGKSALYQMFKAYPYTIETIPLAYGASTLNKLKVQFRYEKYVSTYY